jgi:hypothetical protein
VFDWPLQALFTEECGLKKPAVGWLGLLLLQQSKHGWLLFHARKINHRRKFHIKGQWKCFCRSFSPEFFDFLFFRLFWFSLLLEVIEFPTLFATY